MFSAHSINRNALSVKNLILLFLTIVFGFASIFVLAQITIPSTINNAWQTIMRVTITEDGTDTSDVYRDFNSGGLGWAYVYMDPSFERPSFSWKILGIDDDGNLIYVYSYNLVGSWWSGGGTGDGYRSWDGTHIRNKNPGNVGINTPTPTGKLHIVSSWETDVYIQEQAPTMAASLRLLTPIGDTWIVGWDSDPQIFFIGILGHQEYFSMKTGWWIGIGTTGPKANLQVIGNFIAGEYSNTISGTNSSIAWGVGNSITGNNSFIWWGNGNHITLWWYSNIVWWTNNLIIRNSQKTNRNNIVWWWWNEIYSDDMWGQYWFIWWGLSNKIYFSNYTFIGWGNENTITWQSNYSVIPWWDSNLINNSKYSFAWGRNTKVNTDYTFIWNSAWTAFTWTKAWTFLINVPADNDVGWVGINTPYPQGELHVGGHGVVVFEPQTTNPQGIGSSCSVLGSVVYNKTMVKKLCYCDGTNRHTIDDNTLCSF